MHKTKLEKKLIHKFLQEKYFRKYLNIVNFTIISLMVYVINEIKNQAIITWLDLYDSMLLLLLVILVNVLKKKKR